MLLCLDVGNTHIYAGLFIDKKLKLQFRYPSTLPITSDVFGLFLMQVIRDNQFDPKRVTAICLGSVVPSLDYSIVAACRKYFSIDPLELKPGVKTGLKLEIKNPVELGTDRVANSVAAIQCCPGKNVIIIDFGTATTVCALSKNGCYLGGAIFPGFKLSMHALAVNAEKLSNVDIVIPQTALGKSTETQMQAGIYYNQLGAVKEIARKYQQEYFKEEKAILISTGGYAYLFDQEKLFDLHIPDLVLQGLQIIFLKNKS